MPQTSSGNLQCDASTRAALLYRFRRKIKGDTWREEAAGWRIVNRELGDSTLFLAEVAANPFSLGFGVGNGAASRLLDLFERDVNRSPHDRQSDRGEHR